MSEERLKGSVTLRRTINLGNYSSISPEVSVQFFQDQHSVTEILDAVYDDISKWLEARGIKNEVKAIVK